MSTATVIDAQQVKTLREKTGAGLMECKKALAETSGDIESAIDYLRKKRPARVIRGSFVILKSGPSRSL